MILKGLMKARTHGQSIFRGHDDPLVDLYAVLWDDAVLKEVGMN